METYKSTQGNDLEYGKNVKDWVIRRRSPKPLWYGDVSETERVPVDTFYITMYWLKIQSNPSRKRAIP